MKISKIHVVWCLLILIVSLTGCSGLTRSDQPATKTWWLEPYAGMAHEVSPGAPKLVEISVTVVPGLDTDRILTLSDDAQLNDFAAARWADNLPERLYPSVQGEVLKIVIYNWRFGSFLPISAHQARQTVCGWPPMVATSVGLTNPWHSI